VAEAFGSEGRRVRREVRAKKEEKEE